MGKANEIINGWTNYLLDDKQVLEEVAKARAEICAKCPLSTWGLHTAILPDFSLSEIQGMYCSKKKGGCGCPLSPKVRSVDSNCPLGKW